MYVAVAVEVRPWSRLIQQQSQAEGMRSFNVDSAPGLDVVDAPPDLALLVGASQLQLIWVFRAEALQLGESRRCGDVSCRAAILDCYLKRRLQHTMSV